MLILCQGGSMTLILGEAYQLLEEVILVSAQVQGRESENGLGWKGV